MIEAHSFNCKKRYALSVSGHSGYAPRGSDIVCAGVSALCAALATTLDGLEKKKEISRLDYLLGDGYFYCSFDDGEYDRGRVAFECACNGIGLISECYPSCAALNRKI